MFIFIKIFKVMVCFNVFVNKLLFVRIDVVVCGESVLLFMIFFCMLIVIKVVFDKLKIIFFFKLFMMFFFLNNNVFYVSKL